MRKLLLVPILILGCSSGSSSNKIGPSGGTIDIEDGPSFLFPSGAVDQEIDIVIEETELPHIVPFSAVSLVWKCEPEGTDFAVPVQITMPYFTDTMQPAPNFYWSIGGGDFAVVEDAQVADGIATGSIRHFSVGFVGRPL